MSTLAANIAKLRLVADIWSDDSVAMEDVRTDLLPAVGKGDEFGVLAGSSGVSGNYDDWIEAMAQAATDGSGNFAYLSAALRSIADTYDGTDTTVAQSVQSLDEMVEP